LKMVSQEGQQMYFLEEKKCFINWHSSWQW